MHGRMTHALRCASGRGGLSGGVRGDTKLMHVRCVAAAGVATGDRVLLPEYGGQTVKLNDTECVAAAFTASALRARRVAN